MDVLFGDASVSSSFEQFCEIRESNALDKESKIVELIAKKWQAEVSRRQAIKKRNKRHLEGWAINNSKGRPR